VNDSPIALPAHQNLPAEWAQARAHAGNPNTSRERFLAAPAAGRQTFAVVRDHEVQAVLSKPEVNCAE
jgi:hypothetical protein